MNYGTEALKAFLEYDVTILVGMETMETTVAAVGCISVYRGVVMRKTI